MLVLQPNIIYYPLEQIFYMTIPKFRSRVQPLFICQSILTLSEEMFDMRLSEYHMLFVVYLVSE